jgi:ParB/RepB/Spo0J family partition protein
MTAKQVISDLEIHEVELGSLKAFRGNARVGNVTAIAESLKTNGQFRPIVVRRETSEILAGNHTWKAASQLGWKTIKVSFVDGVSDDEATKIVLADNRNSDLASYDEKALAVLLDSLDGDVIGTGFSPEIVTGLLGQLQGESPIVPDFLPESDDANPKLDQRVSHPCPSCGDLFVMVNGKPQRF